MDGFHLSNRELRRLGRRDRKGAPDTFDVSGYLALLRRLRDRGFEVVCAPEFDRDLDEPLAAAIAVPPDAPLIVTEGKYLLLDDGTDQRNAELLASTKPRADIVVEAGPASWNPPEDPGDGHTDTTPATDL